MSTFSLVVETRRFDLKCHPQDIIMIIIAHSNESSMRWVDEVTLKRRVKCVGSPISCLLDGALPHGYRIFDDFHKLKFVFHRKIRGDFKKVSSRVIDVGLKTFWLHSSRRSSATTIFFLFVIERKTVWWIVFLFDRNWFNDMYVYII